MTELDQRFTDENAQKVLARALELQAQSAGGLTVAQIREIATELSIPQSAVDQALSEYRAAGVAELSPRGDAAAALASLSHHRSAHPVVIALVSVGGAFLVLTILFIILRLFP